MKNLLAYTPETFDNLELENFEYALLANEIDMEEGFVRGKQSRPRIARVKTMPRRSIASVTRKPSRIPRLPQIPPRQPMRPLLPPRIGAAASLNVFPPADDRRPSGQSSSSGNAGGEGSFGNAPAQDVSSEHVRWVQETLNRALGLRLIVDGIMNRETRSAVRMFQERKGLPVTGLVGPDTEGALRAEGGQTAAEMLEGEMSHSGSCSCGGKCSCGGRAKFGKWEGETAQNNPQKVRWIQEALNKILGLSLKVDGIMGPQTKSAIRTFQQKNGLVADGIVGPKTEAAIKNALGSTPISAVPPTDIPAYTQCDFIHDNIDVSAQYALYGMLKSDPVSRTAAVQMLAAVKTGQLGGIYQEDQGVPGMRGIHLGYGGYGPLIETYRKSALSAACIPPAPHHSHKLPIISFKKALTKNISILGEQLKQIYQECLDCKLPYCCKLPYLSPVLASGKICPVKPPPPPLTQKDPGYQPCYLPHCDPLIPSSTCGGDGFGTYYRCLSVPGEKCGICEYAAKCRYPRCDTSYPDAYSCPGKNKKCIPIPGEKCGICEGSANAKRCIEENDQLLRRKRQKCSDEHKQAFQKYLLKCGVDAAKCGLAGNPAACLKTAGCALDPEPLNQYQRCLRQAHEQYTNENERCERLP